MRQLGSKSSTTSFVYSLDAFNDITRQCDSDWDSIAALRCTDTAYETAPEYTAPPVHLRSLPLSVTVTGAVKESEAKWRYDEYGANNALLTSYALISQNDPNRRQAFRERGNVTTEERWQDTDDAFVQRQLRYDIAGNLTRIEDWPVNTANPTSPVTTIQWADSFDGSAPGEPTYAFPTSVTQPGNLSLTATYDWYSDRLRTVVDANGQQTSYTWADPFERMRTLARPIGTTTVDYAARAVTTTNSIGDGRSLVTVTRLDELGRSSGRETSHGDGTVVTKTEYDALGRPHRQAAPGLTVAAGVTTTTFDALDRPIRVQYADGATTHIAYTNNRTLQRDPAGKWMQTERDALGRILNVTESPTASMTADGQTLSNTDPKDYLTSYTWDARDNLRTVTQGDGPYAAFCMTRWVGCGRRRTEKAEPSATGGMAPVT